jgi:hypothetical protein
MIRKLVPFAIAIGWLLFQTAIFADGPNRPKVWIYTDMSDPGLPGTNHRGTINDPDDVSAMAGYLLMADRFETLGIVVASTHRKEHATTPDQADWANRVFGEAYRADVVGLKRSSASYPDDISFVQSCIKESAEKFVDDKRYESLDQYRTVKALFETASQLKDDELINVLCWGSLTEPAILVAHCLATNNESLLKKLRFIAHWTHSTLHQGTPEHPERVANCQEDAAACRYLKSKASAGKIVYYECGAIGQHGIVSGSPKGTEYFDPFRTSRLGTLFVDGKYVHNSVDHSDSATYWVLLGEYGVSLQDIAADGTNPTHVEKANEAKFAAASKRIHDELLRRSMIAATPIAQVAPQAIEAIGLLYSGKADWNAESGTVTFSSSGNMPDSKEGFFWNVPPTVKQIVINSDVTVQGAFRVTFRDAKNPLVVKGLDRKTSVIEGTPQQKWTVNAGIAESDKWRYGAINVVEDAIVHVSNLTSKNPRGYHISGYANKAVIHVDGCNLLDTRGGDNNNSDGFVGAAGSSIRNSFISTADDAIKVYHDITIENVTIEQHRNGAPLQFGWGGENDEAMATIKNLVIRGVSADGRYNLAPLTWADGRRGVRNVSIDGLTIDLQGKIYDQANKSWQPIGLMLVKPTQSTLNLAVKRVKMGDLPHGLNAAQGSVRIEPSIDSSRK